MNWETFEKECTDYLQKNYGTNATFILHGSTDSTVSDIEVFASNNHFWIEAKEDSAQCGQFVVIQSNRHFTFSPFNRSNPNIYVKQIIEHMNNNYDSFADPGTNGIDIDKIDKQVFYNWILNYYENKFVRFFITKKNNNYIIFPIEKFPEYFDVSAKYRIKKSGSKNPSTTDLKELSILLKTPMTSFYSEDGKHVNIVDASLKDGKRITGKQGDYYFRKNDDGSFRITKLSSTENANVIFSIKLKKEQSKEDLLTFENSFTY